MYTEQLYFEKIKFLIRQTFFAMFCKVCIMYIVPLYKSLYKIEVKEMYLMQSLIFFAGLK